MTLPSKCNRSFKSNAEQFIYQESAAVNDKKKQDNLPTSGDEGRGLWTKPEVLARPVKDYKALVVVHDLFMAGTDGTAQSYCRHTRITPKNMALLR